MTVYLGTKRGLLTLDGERVVDGDIGPLAHDGETPWCIVNDREVFRGRERIAIAPIDVTSLAVYSGVALLGTVGARLWRLDVNRREGAFVSSFDALDRTRWGTPWGGPPETMTCALLAAASDAGASWLVGVHVGGVWRSDDDGASWTEVIELDRDDHHIAHRGDDVIVACGGGPIALSRDRGRTFTYPRNGLPHGYGTAVALGDDAALLACSSGPFAKKSILLRASRGSADFVSVRDVRANIHALAAHGATFAYVDDNGDVAFSDDSGKTWRDVGALAARAIVVTA